MKEYWICIIGDTTRDKLPDGSDFPMRSVVQDMFYNLTNEYSEHCWSGWGLSEEKKELILKVWSLDNLECEKLLKKLNG